MLLRIPSLRKTLLIPSLRFSQALSDRQQLPAFSDRGQLQAITANKMCRRLGLTVPAADIARVTFATNTRVSAQTNQLIGLRTLTRAQVDIITFPGVFRNF